MQNFTVYVKTIISKILRIFSPEECAENLFMWRILPKNLNKLRY